MHNPLTCRSLNNLVERFHHSYFLYLQTGEGTFVTVEMYIISVVAFLLGLVLQVGVDPAQGETDTEIASISSEEPPYMEPLLRVLLRVCHVACPPPQSHPGGGVHAGAPEALSRVPRPPRRR